MDEDFLNNIDSLNLCDENSCDSSVTIIYNYDIIADESIDDVCSLNVSTDFPYYFNVKFQNIFFH